VFNRNTDARSRASLPSVLRIGATTAALLAVTVSFAAWSSTHSTAAVKNSAAKAHSNQLKGKACATDRKAGTITYITPFGYSGSPGIIDIFMAQKLGYFKDMCLNVTINATAHSPQTLVGAGTATASSTSGGENLMSYDQEGGNRLVGVETVATFNPESIVLKSSCKSLTCLEGGTFGYYNAIDPTAVAELKAANVDISKVKFVQLTNRNPITAIQEVTGVDSFVGSQDITLKAANVPYTEVTAQSLGVYNTTNEMFMNKAWEQSHKAAAGNFVRATIKALDYCLKNAKQSNACITYLSNTADAAGDATSFNITLNKPVWDFQANTTKKYGTKPLGTFAPGSKAWTITTKAYYQMKTDTEEADRLSGLTVSGKLFYPTEKSMFDYKLASGLYSKSGQLIWP
jgi:putative hydroxymethylpyrimidine transport system substrate-binding protein